MKAFSPRIGEATDSPLCDVPTPATVQTTDKPPRDSADDDGLPPARQAAHLQDVQ